MSKESTRFHINGQLLDVRRGVLYQNTRRMCELHGRIIGHRRKRHTLYYVIDGIVWAFTKHAAYRVGCYFEFCDHVRKRREKAGY